MADMSDDRYFADDYTDGPAVCSPITKAEFDMSESFDSLLPNDLINLVKYTREDYEGVARTVQEQAITGDGPALVVSDTFSMHRLLWVDGTKQKKHQNSDGQTITTKKKATFAVFKVYLKSQTKSSGEGKNRAVQSARIQVEFHDTGENADKKSARQPAVRQPVVVGWAPFATMERPNETTSDDTRNRSVGGSIQGGTSTASGGMNASVSETRAWQRRYFDKYWSHPVTTRVKNRVSSSYNGVVWTMEQNTLAREGVVPELLMYLLVTRSDDEEYAVRITANVKRAGHIWSDDYKCVFCVTPQDPKQVEPSVCYLEGEKMLALLDKNNWRNNFEKLLSPNTSDPSLVLPWSLEEVEGGAIVDTETTAGAKHGNDPPKKEEKEGEGVNVREEDVKDDTTLNAAVSLTTEQPGERASIAPETRRQVATQLVEETVREALLGLYEGGDGYDGDMHDDVPTRMAILENRMEVMELRLARQALVIRALLKNQGR